LYFPFPGYASRDVQRAGYLIRNHVFAYFIGHPHLDHVAGLVLNSPQDYFDGAEYVILLNNNHASGTPADDRPKAKAIVGLPSTLSALNNNVFNNQVWPNLPQITQRYEYRDVTTQNEYHVNDLLGFTTGHIFNEAFDDVAVKFFEICHADVLSTAFLFTAKNATNTERQILYLSDTGLSAPVGNVTCDWRDKLNVIWKDPSLNVRLLTYVLDMKLTFIEVFLLKCRQTMKLRIKHCLVILDLLI
jgi:3',5'-cyclic-nucleotide phosphodiesterase